MHESSIVSHRNSHNHIENFCKSHEEIKEYSFKRNLLKYAIHWILVILLLVINNILYLLLYVGWIRFKIVTMTVSYPNMTLNFYYHKITYISLSSQICSRRVCFVRAVISVVRSCCERSYRTERMYVWS